MEQTVANSKRRKKRIETACPNQLFLQWLEEWRDEAKENGWSSHHSYHKAVKSLKQYPLPLRSGQEAKILEGVGDKIANMLDKKLAKHSTTNADGDSLSSSSTSQSVDTSHIVQPASPLQGGGAQEGTMGCGTTVKERTRGKGKKPQSQGGEDRGTPQSKRKRSSKEYVPAVRSGGYAVLVALSKAEEVANFCGFLSKTELQAAAQPHCDASFTTPSDHESYYTAWSSVSGLVKKGLVQKQGNPAKYSLTHRGAELAHRLLLVGSSGEAGTPPSPHSAGSGTVYSSRSGSSENEVSSKPQRTPSSPPPTLSCPHANPVLPQNGPSGFSLQMPEHHVAADTPQPPAGTSTDDCPALPVKPLRHWYVDTDGRCVLEKDQAAVTFNSAILVGYLIKCLKKDLRQSRVQYILDRSRKSVGEEIYVYLADENAADVCTGLPEEREGEGEAKGGQRSAGRQDCVSSSLPGTAALTEKLPGCSSRGCDGNMKDVTLLLSDDNESEGDMSEVPLMVRLGVCQQQELVGSHCSRAYTPQCSTDSSKAGAEDPQGGCVCLDVGSDTTSESNKGQREIVVTRSGEEHCSSVVPSAGPSKLIDVCGESSKVVGPSTASASGGSRMVGPSTASVSDGSRMVGPSTASVSGGSRLVDASTASASGGSRLVDASTASASSSLLGGSLSGSEASHPHLTGTCASQLQEAPLFTLQSGNFQVVLIVDNQETTTKSMFRGVLLKELSRYGVKFQVRKLQVGDFLWVAQEGVAHQPGQLSLPEAREVVLEYIVERKRMDDLARSIVDKRFGEQKFRMNNCGLPCPVYLVEKFGDASHFSIPERSLKQAIANTQIIDGFHIMETESIQESVAYFTFMTRYIQTMYMGKTLEAYSADYFAAHHGGRTGVRVAGTNCIKLMTFTAFNEGSVKNKVLSITEMFAKQLLHIPGVTPEKAAAIIERYSTPSSLYSAYAACSQDKDKELLLASIKWGSAKRNLGVAISGRIYKLFCS